MITMFNFPMFAALSPDAIIPLLIFIVAVLYSSVGHGGASGYIAVFSFFALSVSHTEIASTALTMNLLAAGGAGFIFYKAGYFRWDIFWPFAAASIPLSFVGGFMRFSFYWYAILLSIVLFAAALRMMFAGEKFRLLKPIQRTLWMQGVLGGCIGFVSGVIGIGGGIFLSPVILLFGWADAKETAAVSAAFIVLNSASGIAGRLAGGNYYVTALLATSLIAAFIGGQIGSRLGANRFSGAAIMRVLGVILALAGVKLLLSVV